MHHPEGKFVDYFAQDGFDENDFIASFEEGLEKRGLQPESIMTPELRAEFEEMARAVRAKEVHPMALYIPFSDAALLKARAVQQGVSVDALINAIIHDYLSK